MPKVAPSPIACPATPVAPPAELAGWNARAALSAGADARTAARLELGKAVDGGLHPTPQVRFALRPEKPGGSVSFGGIYAFSVKDAGKYRVALGSAAWIDVVKDGAAVTSIAHGHGPDCSGIRKMVDFSLEPGEYLLQISANPEAKLPLLVTRLP
ncbi:homogentisate 1,2-dioxygenase [Novosphingobium sp. BL-8H]